MDVKAKIESIESALHNSSDVTSRLLEKNGVSVGFVFLKSMTDNAIFSESLFKPIAKLESVDFFAAKNAISANDVAEIEEGEVTAKVLSGSVVIFLSTSEKFLAVDIMEFNSRTPSEPPTSAVIMGPREGFVEDFQTNISLLRRLFKSEKLVVETLEVGAFSQTKVTICHLEGVADKKIVAQVRRKLKKIKIDGVVDSYYLMAFLSSRPNSILKQVGAAEKPDVVAGKMLEGRVAVIVDNSPIVLTVPFVFLEDLQSSNDYYTNYAYSSLIRIVRVVAIFFACMAPAFYIALQLFHYNVLPIKYLITIADSTRQIPFTPFIEILFISLLFQILYEVSLRLPSYLGLATSVVGALILGDTGVKAGLISPPSVIVVAIAKIALYTIPEQSSQITIVQYVMLFVGASLGILGIVGAMIYFLTYANTIENFGAPYLAPFSPFIASDNKDGVLKVPITAMWQRPNSFVNHNKDRLDEGA